MIIVILFFPFITYFIEIIPGIIPHFLTIPLPLVQYSVPVVWQWRWLILMTCWPFLLFRYCSDIYCWPLTTTFILWPIGIQPWPDIPLCVSSIHWLTHYFGWYVYSIFWYCGIHWNCVNVPTVTFGIVRLLLYSFIDTLVVMHSDIDGLYTGYFYSVYYYSNGWYSDLTVIQYCILLKADLYSLRATFIVVVWPCCCCEACCSGNNVYCQYSMCVSKCVAPAYW